MRMLLMPKSEHLRSKFFTHFNFKFQSELKFQLMPSKLTNMYTRLSACRSYLYTIAKNSATSNNRETLDADGWLYTDDIGKCAKQNVLRIVDRKKHIFKLTQVTYKSNIQLILRLIA